MFLEVLQLVKLVIQFSSNKAQIQQNKATLANRPNNIKYVAIINLLEHFNYIIHTLLYL